MSLQELSLCLTEQNLVGLVDDVKVGVVICSFNQQALSRGDVKTGTYCLIRAKDVAVFGMLSGVTRTADGASGTLELIASFDLNDGRFITGVVGQPAVSSGIYLASDDLVKLVVEQQAGDDSNLSIVLGRLPHNMALPIRFTPERLFGRHLAVVGTSGGGKSWTVSRLLGECNKFNSKLILLDATGEFHTLRDGVKHVYIGTDPDPGKEMSAVSMPYYHLNEIDLFGIFSPTGQSQAAKLRAAIDSLKLARLAPHLAPDGTIIKAYKEKHDFLRERANFTKELEDKRALFDVSLLPFQIRHECVDSQKSPTEPFVWGGHNSVDYSNCVPLINRINDINTSHSLSPIFKPGSMRSIFDEVALFLRDSRTRVLRINLQYLSFAHHAREIAVNALGRFLLDSSREGAFVEQPLVVFIDEAHQFLNNSLALGEDSFKLDSFALIAKEGRKYALTLTLATQRPRDIPEDVLSQMGTLIVHRLININDKEIIESASGFIDEASSTAIPVLASGEAIMVGVGFPIPLHIKVDPPSFPPDSKSADYQKYWS